MNSDQNKGEMLIYQFPDNSNQIEVRLEGDTIWLTRTQMAILFDTTPQNISIHLKSIYNDAELDENSVSKESLLTAPDGKKYKTNLYNLDAILSIGYRISSKMGTQFRIWATQRLKDYLVKGYAINERRLIESAGHLKMVGNLIEVIKEAQKEGRLNITNQEVLVDLISTYTKAFSLFNEIDTDSLQRQGLDANIIYEINFDDAFEAVMDLKAELVKKGEATDGFGQEIDSKFKSAIGAVAQTFGGQYLYPTIEEQAANLLYLVAEGHVFDDGNKRAGSFLFIWFLEKNNYRFKSSGELKINDNALVLLALLVAQSGGQKKEFYIDLIINLISSR